MQTRYDSAIEAVTNTAVGFIISYIVWIGCAWLFNTRTDFMENLLIVSIFTITSLLRQYILRRLFNGRSPGAALAATINGSSQKRTGDK